MTRKRTLIWAALVVVLAFPLGIAATSPLLQWREPIYIAAGFAGIVGLGLLLVQPLLAGGLLPGLEGVAGRKMHRWTGALLVLAVLLHVGGLWITSPPDVIDVLLFRSPTPFSVWGAIAMWAVFVTALIALVRKRLRITPRRWRTVHTSLAVVILGGTIVHALLIEGTMGTLSKIFLCILAIIATARVVWRPGSAGNARSWISLP